MNELGLQGGNSSPSIAPNNAELSNDAIEKDSCSDEYRNRVLNAQSVVK